MNDFSNDIIECCKVLKDDGLILYPTDTIWGIGCDATNKNAVDKIYRLKKRSDKKSLIILVAEQNDIFNYVECPDEKIFEYLSATEKPTSVIYENGKKVAKNLIGADGTVAIRIIKDNFCKELIRQFKKPIVSTSANISEAPFPKTFGEVSDIIKNGVDYIVQHRQNDHMLFKPSSIIKLDKEANIEIVR